MRGIASKAVGAALLAASLAAAPARAQPSPDASQAQDLTNCAGAVAARAGFDVLAFPQGAHGEWAPVLAAILARANHEEGIEGMTGRYAASAARGFWLEQSAAERNAFADECRTRYGS